MATYTSNYGWTKPSGSDNVDISVLNNNLDNQDSVIHNAFLNMAPPFSESSTYAVDDIVLYDTGLYKCHTAVVTPGSWTGSTNWQVYKLSEGGGGGGGTSDYTDLTNKPQINGVTLSGNKSTSDLGINAAGVGLGNVPNVSTNDQEPTFTEATTRNNIASGEKLSVILGKVQKFFNDLKTVAFSGSYTDLSNKPQINSVELSGNKTVAQLGLMASDGVVANPTGQTTGTLTALEVGGTKYAVSSGGGGTSDYTDLNNKPQINGVELSGNKTASQLGMANSNTFQGSIAEWNQLTTEEKKAYDHASIPDSIDGGVTFPANKVIMTGGGNVEEVVEGKKLTTVSGTTLAALATAWGALTDTQKDNCIKFKVNNHYMERYTTAVFRRTELTGSKLNQEYVSLGSTPAFGKYEYILGQSSATSSEITVTSWEFTYIEL